METIRTHAEAREAYRALAALRQMEFHLERARHFAECAEIEFPEASPGFGKKAAAEIGASESDMELASLIEQFEEALSRWEERGTSEPARLLVQEVI